MHIKKRLLLLILCSLISWHCFSQIDTNSILLPKETAKKIVKDLLEGDLCKENLQLTQGNLNVCSLQLLQKDSIISNLNDQVFLNRQIIDVDSMKYNIVRQENKDLKRQYLRLKIRDTIKTIGGTAIVAALVLALIFK